MPRLLVHVEGQTEEDFVNEILRPHLYRVGYSQVTARLVGNSRQRHRRGGITGWPAVRSDVVNHLRQDPTCLATTMVDYYALPKSGSNAWPGREVASQLSFSGKAKIVQDGMLKSVVNELGPGFDARRFIPYVMMHEFEALLFSDCTKFAEGIGQANLASHFQGIRELFESPEEINDSPLTAPSKRISQHALGYEKPFHGVLAIISIGLDTIRNECPHFAGWLRELEARQSI